MVKGISRQVIVVQSPEPALFEQAIFIIKDNVLKQGVTDDALMKEAQKLLSTSGKKSKPRFWLYGSVWACAGALLTAVAWVLCSVL